MSIKHVADAIVKAVGFTGEYSVRPRNDLETLYGIIDADALVCIWNK